MAESIKTKLMEALSSKDTPADTDTMIIAEGNTLKKTTIAKLVDFWKAKLGINDLSTKLGSAYKVRTQMIDNVEIPANGLKELSFNQLTTMKGYSRYPINCSIDNATSDGKYSSYANHYLMSADANGVTVVIKNFANVLSRLKVTVIVLYASDSINS